MTTEPIPSSQHAVQLVGPDQLSFNDNKPVDKPGPHQVLARIEAVGLCFSDLKLLKQFTGHVRKSEVVDGIDPSVLGEVPSYVPGEKATVPGHELVVRITAAGDQVTKHKVGDRYLVQTDYRWLRTANSNAAFGYNFEGGLQEYVIMDERVITNPHGESMLIPVPEDLSASAICLVEPWACVEDAYLNQERTTIKPEGQLLLVADEAFDPNKVCGMFEKYGKPGKITWRAEQLPQEKCRDSVNMVDSLDALEEGAFDDIIYFGADADTAEKLFPLLAKGGILNIVQNGKTFGKPVVTQVGRVHYGGIRVIGTTSDDPAEAMAIIPETCEIRPNDKINVVGAGGPMGVMHVIRSLCQGVPGVSVHGGDLSDERLDVLTRLAAPIAEKNKLAYTPYNPTKEVEQVPFTYFVIMAPVPALVAASIGQGGENALINIFAGIPATVSAEMDLDTYIAKKMYFIGTSGSELEDMKSILSKVVAGTLDTNISVAAISGLEGAIDGIRAVENHSIAGKIIVYPCCKGMELTELSELSSKMPAVAEKLADGLWTREAEQALVETAGK